MDNRKIELLPSKIPGQFQIILKGLTDSNHIGMFTQYSLIAFETEEEIDELINSLIYMRDITYKGKGTLK